MHEHAKMLQMFNVSLRQALEGISHHEKQKAREANTMADGESIRILQNEERLTTLLKIAVDESDSCVNELLRAVGKLRNMEPNAKWQSFRYALISILGESKVEAMNQRLTRAQQNVTLFLVLSTR
jgi:hypothetical protein